MSYLSPRPEQSTTAEITALTNLASLPVAANSAIVKTGATTFAQVALTSGTGTVTSVSVVSNQGVSGSVATATTTPAITLTLGALTGVTSFNGLVVTANTGTITTGVWNGTAVTVANGGTGNTTFTAYSVILAGTTATGVFQNVTGLGTSGDVLTSNGAGAIPSWQTPASAPTNFADNVFYIKDDGDAAKRIAFQASGITTANTRVITMIDADLTIVGLTNAQALTGKTYNGLTVSTSSGTLTIANNASASLITAGNFALTLTATATTNSTFPAGTDTLAGLGTAQTFTKQNTFSPALTIASASGAVWDDLNVSAQTTTVSGTTQITTAKGFNKVSLYKPTVTDGSSVTIDNSATLYIEAAPLAAGSVTITNAYALWIDAGNARFDGHLVVEGVTSTGATGTGKFVFDASPTLVTPTLGVATATSINSLTITTSTGTLTITNLKTVSFSNSITFAGTDSTTMTFPAASDTVAGLGTTQTFTGINTFSPAARGSGVASYLVINTPADTAQTAATESIGIKTVTATRTWATTGTVALQREIFLAGPTYASAGASQTFTDAQTLYITPPVAGSNAIFTRGHTLTIVDATSAASSITGGFIVATTLGTTATSVGIGGGNINAGGTLTVGGHVTLEGVTSTGATGTGKLVFDGTPTLVTPVLGAATATSITSSGANQLSAGSTVLLVVPTSAGATGPTTAAFNSGFSSTAAGDLLYLDSSTTWQKADADLSTAAEAGMLAIALTVAASGAAPTVALPGSFVFATAWNLATVGAPVYMSATAGAITLTAPVTTDSATRIIGWVVASGNGTTKIWFQPSPDYITHT